MIYGGRTFKSQRLRENQETPISALILHKGFQSKYAWYFLIAVAGGCLLFFIPVFYFLNQNYHIFIKLGYNTHPELVKYMEREVTWLAFFMIVSFLAVTISTAILTIKMTKNIIGPITLLERHLKLLLAGQWSTPQIEIAANEDYKDLLTTYDYFCRSLKLNTEKELQLLEQMNIDSQNREAYASWKNLIYIKRTRLGLTQEKPFDQAEVIVASSHLRKVA